VSADLEALVEELLRQSLAAWRIEGEVRWAPEGRIALTAGGRVLVIWRAVGNGPFRWMVDEGARTRGVISIAGLLRFVRAAVDPGHRPVRLRIAPLPLAPP
jgi:hypothetical protein